MKKVFLAVGLFAAAQTFGAAQDNKGPLEPKTLNEDRSNNNENDPKKAADEKAAAEKAADEKAAAEKAKGFFTKAKETCSNAVESVNNFVYNNTPFSDKFVAANDYVTSTLTAYPKTAVVATAVVAAAVVNAFQDSEEAEL